jgi:hypothetical protein
VTTEHTDFDNDLAGVGVQNDGTPGCRTGVSA